MFLNKKKGDRQAYGFVGPVYRLKALLKTCYLLLGAEPLQDKPLKQVANISKELSLYKNK